MREHKLNPIARIALRGEPPRELHWLLPLLSLDPYGWGGIDSQLVAVFSRHQDTASSLDVRADSAITTVYRDVVCRTPLTAASFLLSCALGLDEPMLFADDEGFDLLRQAVGLAAGSARILITGESDTGKRSLAKLIARASGDKLPVSRINCTNHFDVAKSTTCGGPAAIGTPRSFVSRTVILEHIDELPAASQDKLAQVIRSRRGKVRYLATAKSSSSGAALDGLLQTTLQSEFDAVLKLPPLRSRAAQMIALIDLFLLSLTPHPELAPSALEALCDLPLDGNVGELRNRIVRLGVLARDRPDRLIAAEDVIDDCALASGAGNRPTHSSAPHQRPSVKVSAKRQLHLRLVPPRGHKPSESRAHW